MIMVYLCAFVSLWLSFVGRNECSITTNTITTKAQRHKEKRTAASSIIILLLLMLQPLVPAAYSTDDEVDAHALAAPASVEGSVKSLAAYLIEPAANDREKARAIFRWICENIDYNVDVFFSGKAGSTNSTDVLKSRKSVCYGYSDLFLALAEEAGLEARRIKGYGKGYGYLPGTNFTGPSNHAWNAVRINGSWYLVDSTWGAGYVSGDGKYVRHFEEHFFMTPPAQFIFNHFPEEEQWQLLDEPLSKAEFEGLVYLEPDFFGLGLMLGEEMNGTIQAGGDVNVSIFAPGDVLMMVALQLAGGGAELDGYSFCQRDGSRYDLLARFPAAGRYILKAYAKDRNDTGEYDSVLEYLIVASSEDEGGSGFPKAFAKFPEAGCYLVSPLQGRLEAGKSYWFSIRVPGAEDVAVVSGEEWTHLAKQGDLFEGNATAGQEGAGVYASIGGGKWDSMLIFISKIE